MLEMILFIYFLALVQLQMKSFYQTQFYDSIKESGFGNIKEYMLMWIVYIGIYC